MTTLTLPTYRRRVGTPDNDSPAYRSTALRHPNNALHLLAAAADRGHRAAVRSRPGGARATTT